MRDELTLAAARIEDESIAATMDGYNYCRYCGLAQNHAIPVHDDDCPVTVIKRWAEKLRALAAIHS